MGCLRVLLLPFFLVAVAWAGYQWWEPGAAWVGERLRDVGSRVEDRIGIDLPDSPFRSGSGSPDGAAGERAMDRIGALLRGEVTEVALDGTEVTAALHYSYPHLLPPEAIDPRVRFRDETVTLEMKMVPAELPSLPELGGVLEMLPDTVPLSLLAQVETFGPSGAPALRVGSIEVAGLPLPARFHPVLLEELGREPRPGLGTSSIALPLPTGIETIRIEGGRLVLSSRR